MSKRLTLNSSSSKESFPHNQMGDYTIKLPERISLEENCQVALTEIILPNHIYNVRHNYSRGSDIKMNEVKIYRPKKVDKIYNYFLNKLNYADAWGEVLSIEVPEGYYDDWRDIVSIINEKLSWDNWTDQGYPELVSDSKSNKESIPRRIDFTYNPDLNQITMTANSIYGVRLGLDLETILGLQKHKSKIKNETFYCYYGITSAKKTPYERRLIDLIYVNSNIISDVQMGDQYAKCLRVFPAYSRRKNEQPGAITKTFKELYFNKLFHITGVITAAV